MPPDRPTRRVLTDADAAQLCHDVADAARAWRRARSWLEQLEEAAPRVA